MDTNIALVGQSFIIGLMSPSGMSSFLAEFTRAGLHGNGSGNTVNVLGHGIDGCPMLKQHAPAGYPDRYYWDTDTDEPGPALIETVAAINAFRALHGVINLMGLAQGEADSGDNVDPQEYMNVHAKVLTHLREACNPTWPNAVGVTMHVIGRRISTANRPGVQKIREAQLTIIETLPPVFGWDTFSLPLLGDDPIYPGDSGNSHMTPIGNAMMGSWAAQRFLVALGKASRMQPHIGSCARVASNAFKVSIGTVLPLIKPSTPSHTAIRDPNNVVIESNDLLFGWSGNWLTVTNPLGDIPSGSKFLVPYGNLNTIDRENLIRDITGKVLQSSMVTIP